MKKENKTEWKPGFQDAKKDVFVEYERGWFCNESKIIHTSEKAFLSCKKCNPDKV